MNITHASIISTIATQAGFKKETNGEVYKMNGYTLVHIPCTSVLRLITPTGTVVTLKHHSLQGFITTLASCKE